MRKSKRNESYQSSWYKTRAVYAAMHIQTQKNARFTFLLSLVFFRCFLRALECVGAVVGSVVVSEAFRSQFESHLGAKMEPKSAFFGSP